MNISFDREKNLKLFLIAGFILLADQATKLLIVNKLTIYQTISVIDGFFNITYVLNPGGAFGFLAGQNEMIRGIVFLFISSVALVVIFYFYMTTPKSFLMLSIGFALIFGGALGNLLDRIRMGKVVDFLDFYIGSVHWPAFNVADSAICVGVTIFCYHVLFKKMPEFPEEKANSND